MPIYMKFGDYKGEVTAAKYKEWIEVGSFQWGVGRGISMPTGGGVGTRESSTPSVSEITVTKATDASTTDLLKNVLGAKMDTKVKFDFTRTGDKGEEMSFLHLELTDTAVSGYSVSSGGDRPSESLSLNFTKIEYKVITIDDKGGSKPSTVTYNLLDRKLT